MENMLKREVKKQFGVSKGTMVGNMVGLVVGLILSIAVVIPVTQDIISSIGLTGTAGTILDTVLILVTVVPIVLIAGFIA